jgi:hypothetical protein
MGDSIFAKSGKANDKEIEFFGKWVIKYFKNGFSEYIEFVKIINNPATE